MPDDTARRLRRIVGAVPDSLACAPIYLEVLACGHLSSYGHRTETTIARLIAASKRRACDACLRQHEDKEENHA